MTNEQDLIEQEVEKLKQLPDQVEEQPDGSLLVNLTSEIQVEGSATKQLKLKKPTAGTFRKLRGNMATETMEMACQFVTLTGNIPPSSVNQISGNDFNTIILPLFAHFFVS